MFCFRYLATDSSFNDLSFQFYLRATAIGDIVKETTLAIWTRLQHHFMTIPTKETWEKI